VLHQWMVFVGLDFLKSEVVGLGMDWCIPTFSTS